MPDREKVIEALRCRAYDDDFPCSICAYYRPDENPVAKCDYRGLMDDAIALLKEPDAVKPKSKTRHGANAQIQHFCGNCNSMLHGKPKHCSECGKGVLW